jgi:hypothetical protein
MTILDNYGTTFSHAGIGGEYLGTARDHELASASVTPEDGRQTWQRLIDERLIEWGRDPAAFEDDGCDPPAQPAINAANEFAAFMRDSGAQPPERIALDPDGGIVFEWGDEIHAVTIEIDPTGSMELIAYRHNRIQARHVLA